jgi:hypothetical protein
MRISRDLGLNGLIGFNLFLLGLLALHQNDYSFAAFRFQEYFSFDRDRHENLSLSRFFTGSSAVAAGTNQPERAAQLFGAAQAILENSDHQLERFDRAEFDRHIQIAREQLGKAKFEAIASEGRAMPLGRAIEYAIEISTRS